MKRRTALLFALTLAAIGTATLAATSTWPGAGPPVDLSQGISVRSREKASLAVNADTMAAAWSSETPAALWIVTATGGTWTHPFTLPVAAGTAAWNPALAYSGTQLLAAWTQGTAPSPGNLSRAIVQQDVGLTAPQIVTAGVYGYAVPSLAVGQSALHITFAAATESQSWSQGNLYYTARSLTSSTWSSPTLVLTHSQVLPPGHSGKIWYPRIAVGPGETIHIVWEQEESYVQPPTTYLTHTIWYISGTWRDGRARWHPPLRLSPPDQPHAVRPNLAVKPDGSVYVVWSELIVGGGGLTNPDAQHINGCTVGRDDAQRLSGLPLLVNDNFPTYAESSVAVDGARLCVAWHGFYTGEKEEGWLRCSDDGGKTWGGILNISQSDTWLSIFPIIALERGYVHTIWVEYTLSGSTVTPVGLFYRQGSAAIAWVYLPLITRSY